MPKLHIHRISEMENRFRAIRIEIDGKLAGKIKNGESMAFDLTPGKHLIQAKIDWGTSNVIEMHLRENDTLELDLTKGKGSVFYRAFFGYREYLLLEKRS